MSRVLIAAEYAHKLAIIELTAPASEKGFRIAALMAERSVRLEAESKAPRYAYLGLYRLANADLKRRHQQERKELTDQGKPVRRTIMARTASMPAC